VTLLAVLDFLGGSLALLGGIFVLASPGMREGTDAVIMMVAGGIYAVIGALYLAAGVGMLQLRNWGRLLQIGLACLGLLGVPCGTIISVLILIYLLKPGAKVLFSGRTAEELTPSEAAEVAQVLQGSGATVVIVAIVALVGLVAFIGIIAAIAIPSLLRARIAANESAALGRLQQVLSAEVAYAGANSGFVDRPECLAAPATCLRSTPASASSFLDGSILFDAPQTGYVLHFHPGPPPSAEVLAQGSISPSSLQSFALVAVPAVVGRTGKRSFCTDLSGRMCVFIDGSTPPIQDGVCPATCDVLH
jgi:type IV pilus assembly protein PilA